MSIVSAIKGIGRISKMDRQQAIANFEKNAKHLVRLPFVTNREMEQLYGEEFSKTLEKLNRLGREEQVCLGCPSCCCAEHSCEFYDPQFNQCPVFDFRPVICRVHFCERFKIADRSIITELSETFLYGVHSLAASGSARSLFFDPPPFARVIPGLVASISPWVSKVRAGKITPQYGRRHIRQEVSRYRCNCSLP